MTDSGFRPDLTNESRQCCKCCKVIPRASKGCQTITFSAEETDLKYCKVSWGAYAPGTYTVCIECILRTLGIAPQGTPV